MGTGAELTGMALILSKIGTTITAVVGWVPKILGTFTAEGNEMLLFLFCLGGVWFAIKLVKKLAHVFG